MKKLILITSFLLFCSTSYAGIVVCEGQNGNVNHFDLSEEAIDGCFYYDEGQNVTTKQADDLREIKSNVPLRYMKIESGFPVEMTQQEKDDRDALLTTAQKNSEIARIDSGNVTGEEILKALPVVIANSSAYKEITEDVIKEEIKTQKGLA